MILRLTCYPLSRIFEDDGTIRLFLTEPYGLYFEYRAVAIGEGEPDVMDYLQKKYKPNMSVEDGLKLGLAALQDYLKSDFNYERVDAVYINTEKRRYTKLTNDELKKYAK